jgi:hypothetical protein
VGIISLLAVTSQAVFSLAFLVRLTFLRWWETVSGQVAAGLAACLFLLTATLTFTGSNEGLGNTPVAVTVGRFGFTAVCLYGLIASGHRWD